MKIYSFVKNGFTLAEVLITLAIIGIVAVITIPALIQKNTEKHLVSSLKKSFSVLSNAYQLASIEFGLPDTWSLNDALYDENGVIIPDDDGSMKVLAVFNKYLKSSKICPSNELSCFANEEYKLINGNTYIDFSKPVPWASMKLNDGTTLLFESMTSGCSKKLGPTSALQNICASVYVDVNGDKAPNVLGKDMFGFYITKFGIIPRGVKEQTGSLNFENSCNLDTKAEGYGCTAWVIYNNNMDYLHCGGLSWDGNHKCSDK